MKSSHSKLSNKNSTKKSKDTYVNSERSKVDLAFETAMLEMSFDNLSGLLKTFGIPAPHAKKIKEQARLIAMFNQRMVESGRPEEVINMGEKLLPWILKIATAEMFIEPIGKWLLDMKGKKDSEIVQKTKSMR